MIHLMHDVLLVLVLTAWRVGILWFRPFHPVTGKRRLGAGRVQRARMSLHRALSGGDQ